MTSWSPTSHANKIPSSIALTSASSGPSGTQSFLLMAAMTCPSWSRATTPIPVACVCLKTAPSTFILYQGLFGGVHVMVCGTVGGWNLWLALRNSSSRNVAIWRMWLLVCRVPPVLAVFLSCQRHHAIVTMSPKSSSPTCWTNIKCQRRSRKEWNRIPWSWIGMPNETQTTWAISHSHETWPLVSASSLHASHVALAIMFQLQRLAFVDKTFLQARHVKDWILLGMCSCQIVLQNSLAFWVLKGPPLTEAKLSLSESATL